MLPDYLQKLIPFFKHLPGVGPRTAERYAERLLSLSDKELEEFGNLISRAKHGISACPLCYQTTQLQGEKKMCRICLDEKRDRTQICAVEENRDLSSIEKTREYKGLYHILGGTISPLDGRGPENLHIRELYFRVKNARPKIKEIIIATSPTTEGDATALYVEQVLKPLGVKTTKLARGLATGVELEYADDITLINALKNRK